MDKNFMIRGRLFSWTVIRESHQEAKGVEAEENSTIMGQALQ